MDEQGLLKISRAPARWFQSYKWKRKTLKDMFLINNNVETNAELNQTSQQHENKSNLISFFEARCY